MKSGYHKEGRKNGDQRWIFCEVFPWHMLLANTSHGTEGEGAKVSWQQDEFHVMGPMELELGSHKHTVYLSTQ